MIPQDYTVIDLEMTGLHPKNDAILEVGAAKIRNGEVTDTMDIFVNPGRKITQEITELTGITDEMVKESIYNINTKHCYGHFCAATEMA